MEKDTDSKKSVFELPDDDDQYQGPEQRNKQRRKGDRREMVRYEPDKEDRRKGKDRRKPKSVWDDRPKD